MLITLGTLSSKMDVEELEYDLLERLMADSSYKMIDEVSGDRGGQRRHESSSMI